MPYHHNDRLGSGVAITDEQGEPVHILAYMPYGETLLDLSKGFETPYQFTGYEKDQETGLNYAQARYYDSDLSIFNSTDPMWHKYPHITPYNYCANNPIMRVDPTGEDWYRDDETGSTFWQEGNADFVNNSDDGARYRNIGETYSTYRDGLRIDYNQNEVTEVTDVNTQLNLEGGQYIPKQFITDDGTVVMVDMNYKTKDGNTADNAITKDAVSLLINGINEANNNGENITNIGLSATTNGEHSSGSLHYKGKAIDICTINKTATGSSSKVVGVQNAMNSIDNIKENFGPSLKTRFGKPWRVGGHNNHIHISVK